MSSFAILANMVLSLLLSSSYFPTSGMWEMVNPGYMSGADGQAEKSMGRGKRDVGAPKASIHEHLISLLNRVKTQKISMERSSYLQVQMPEAAAGREGATFILAAVRTPSLRSLAGLVPPKASWQDNNAPFASVFQNWFILYPSILSIRSTTICRKLPHTILKGMMIKEWSQKSWTYTVKWNHCLFSPYVKCMREISFNPSSNSAMIDIIITLFEMRC